MKKCFYKLIIIIFLIISSLLFLGCPYPADDGEINITMYGYESTLGYEEIKITIDRIEVHARGQEWKVIGDYDDTYLIDIVYNPEYDEANYKGEFVYNLSKNILEPGEYTELRLRVIDVNVLVKNPDDPENPHNIPVIIPSKNEDGYTFPEIFNIYDFSDKIYLELTFYPDQSIETNDEDENIFNLKGDLNLINR